MEQRGVGGIESIPQSSDALPHKKLTRTTKGVTMDFKKMLEYNSPKNLHKRLTGLNNTQKVMLLVSLTLFICGGVAMFEQASWRDWKDVEVWRKLMFFSGFAPFVGIFLFSDKQ